LSTRKLRQEFPALRSLVATPHNLPQQLNSFVGRQRALADVRHLLAKHRLLTLVGVGGLGKTRLSLQAGADALEEFADGVWFVELAPLGDARLVPQAVASVLAVNEDPARPVRDVLVDHVRDRKLLLILDNCEHVRHGCAELAKRLLESGPGLKVLASSREPLHIPGEAIYPLSTLDVPEAGQRLARPRWWNTRPCGCSTTARSPRIPALRSPSSTRRPSPTSAAGWTESRSRSSSRRRGCARCRCRRSLKRLSDRFPPPDPRDSTASPRQQTLRACIDWSHDLLVVAERMLFRRLAVFAGGWTLSAAEAVACDDRLPASEALELLTRLVEKSLVERAADDDRYSMLETIRQYAQDQLEARVTPTQPARDISTSASPLPRRRIECCRARTRRSGSPGWTPSGKTCWRRTPGAARRATPM
jgi:predicted ATPase